MSTSITIDVTRGVDVFRGSKLVEHFEGADAYERAKAKAAERLSYYVRYWGVKPEEKEEE
jgi:hypothetical protein